MALCKELLEILVCPKCRGEIFLLDDRSGLVCPACHLKYPVRDNIPVMLIDEAEEIKGEVKRAEV